MGWVVRRVQKNSPESSSTISAVSALHLKTQKLEANFAQRAFSGEAGKGSVCLYPPPASSLPEPSAKLRLRCSVVRRWTCQKSRHSREAWGRAAEPLLVEVGGRFGSEDSSAPRREKGSERPRLHSHRADARTQEPSSAKQREKQNGRHGTEREKAFTPVKGREWRLRVSFKRSESSVSQGRRCSDAFEAGQCRRTLQRGIQPTDPRKQESPPGV